MELGIYGLGRMGGNMAVRLRRGGHRVVAGNRSAGPVRRGGDAGRGSGLLHRGDGTEARGIAEDRLAHGAVWPGYR